MKSSQRVLLNSLITYTRMALTMPVGLLITRFAIDAMGGLEAWGVVTSLGAAGMLLGTLTQSLVDAGQYHLGHASGLEETDRRHRALSSLVALQLATASLLLLFGGLLYPVVFEYLSIPEEHLAAAKWVYALNLLLIAVTIGTSAHQSLLLANERFLGVALFDVVARLATLLGVLLLFILPMNPLIGYAVVGLVVLLLQRASLLGLCLWHFPEAVPRWRYCNWQVVKEITQYASWSVLGTMTWRVRVQGALLLLNVFFGSAIAGAFSVAIQVIGYQNRIGAAIGTPMLPTMTRRYAAHGVADGLLGQYTLSQCKFMTFATILLAAPFIMEASVIVELWLGHPVPWAATFISLSSLAFLLTRVSDGYMTAMRATANLRWITLLPVLANTTMLGVAWLIFATVPSSPIFVPLLDLFLAVVMALLWRPWYAGRLIQVPYTAWLKQVAGPMFGLLLVQLGVWSLAGQLLSPGLLRLVIAGVSATLLVLPLAWYWGLNATERRVLREAWERVATRLGPAQPSENST